MANRTPDTARPTDPRSLGQVVVAGIALYVAVMLTIVVLNLVVILLDLETAITGLRVWEIGGLVDAVPVAVFEAGQTSRWMTLLLATGVGAYALRTERDADPPWAAGAIAAGLGCAVALGLLLVVLIVTDPTPGAEPSYTDALIGIALYAVGNAALAAIVAAVLDRLRE